MPLWKSWVFAFAGTVALVAFSWLVAAGARSIERNGEMGTDRVSVAGSEIAVAKQDGSGELLLILKSGEKVSLVFDTEGEIDRFHDGIDEAMKRGQTLRWWADDE